MIDQAKVWRELMALPPEAQQQVLDFIAFMRSRYQTETFDKETPSIDWQNHPFVGMWKNHEEMKDSTQWVRQQRRQEWG